MSEMTDTRKETKPVSKWRMYAPFAFALAAVFALSVVVAPPASATIDINGTIGPIIQDIADLIPDIIDLIVAMVPAILVLSVVGFVITFLDKILGMFKM